VIRVLIPVAPTCRHSNTQTQHLRELRHSHSYLLEVFLQFVCVDAHRYCRIIVTEYLADPYDSY